VEKLVGIWIDHSIASIVILQDEDEHVRNIESDAESRHRAAGGSPAPTKYGPGDPGDQKRLEQRRQHELQEFYQSVVEALEKPDAIVVMGPGTAKTEFEKELKKDQHLAGKLKDVKSADKMTERQWVAEVRKYYGKQAPRITDQTRR